jgi:hypothetical protein
MRQYDQMAFQPGACGGILWLGWIDDVVDLQNHRAAFSLAREK